MYPLGLGHTFALAQFAGDSGSPPFGQHVASLPLEQHVSPSRQQLPAHTAASVSQHVADVESTLQNSPASQHVPGPPPSRPGSDEGNEEEDGSDDDDEDDL